MKKGQNERKKGEGKIIETVKTTTRAKAFSRKKQGFEAGIQKSTIRNGNESTTDQESGIRWNKMREEDRIGTDLQIQGLV